MKGRQSPFIFVKVTWADLASFPLICSWFALICSCLTTVLFYGDDSVEFVRLDFNNYNKNSHTFLFFRNNLNKSAITLWQIFVTSCFSFHFSMGTEYNILTHISVFQPQVVKFTIIKVTFNHCAITFQPSCSESLINNFEW